MKKLFTVTSCLLLLFAFCSCKSDVSDSQTLGFENGSVYGSTSVNTYIPPVSPVANELTVTFYDVGKADFILIQTEGKTAIIDTGYSDNWELVEQALNENGVKTVDYLIATHPDKDHIGCMNKVMKNYTVTTLYMCPLEADSKEYKKMMKASSENGVAVRKANVGDTFTLGKAEFLTLSPDAELVDAGDENEASVVLLMTYENVKMLFSADAQLEAEKKIVSSGVDISADVIKIGHHGSEQSSSESYLKKVGAKYAVISTGERDGEKVISSDTVDKLNGIGSVIFRTDLQGTVTVKTDGENIEFETEY